MQQYSLNYKNRGLTTGKVFAGAVLFLLLVLALLRIVFGFIYVKVYVVGNSMGGTLTGAPSEDEEGGDYVYAFRTSSPRHGDIVVINTGDKSKPIIKRVIALGGDTVELKEGVLYLNGFVFSEPYVRAENNTPTDPKNTFPATEVPDGYMFFMGDNRDVSVDSRSDKYGMMPVTSLMGVVADWSMTFKGAVTSFNTFFDFTIGNALRG